MPMFLDLWQVVPRRPVNRVRNLLNIVSLKLWIRVEVGNVHVRVELHCIVITLLLAPSVVRSIVSRNIEGRKGDGRVFSSI